MADNAYIAFVVWCADHDVRPVSQVQYNTWTHRRMERWMRETLKRKQGSNKVATDLPPMLF